MVIEIHCPADFGCIPAPSQLNRMNGSLSCLCQTGGHAEEVITLKNSSVQNNLLPQLP